MLRLAFPMTMLAAAASCYTTGPPSSAFHPFASNHDQFQSVASHKVELFWVAPHRSYNAVARISVARRTEREALAALRRLAGKKGCDGVVSIDVDHGTKVIHVLTDQVVSSVVSIGGICAVYPPKGKKRAT